jgi:uncharacterized membrane protein YfcA
MTGEIFNLLRAAVGVSLVSVIMTSSAAAGVYLERHVANLRLGMTLELFTATGALIGGLVAFLLDERLLSLLFAVLLAYVAFTMARPRSSSSEPEAASLPPGPEVDGPVGRAASIEADLSGDGYAVRHLGFGVLGSTGAGIVSALLGIGGGIIKVPLMHLVMGVPLRTATATSNLMIGITAAASAVIYTFRGEIDPYVAGPTAIGVFIGATIGSRLAPRIDLRILRLLFVVVLSYTSYQMLMRALA